MKDHLFLQFTVTHATGFRTARDQRSTLIFVSQIRLQLSGVLFRLNAIGVKDINGNRVHGKTIYNS